MMHLIKLIVDKNYGRYYGQVQSSGQRRSSAAKELFRSSHRRCSMKKLFLKIVSAPQAQACNFIKKETRTQVFSCELCEIFKNTFFKKHLLTTASGYSQNLQENMNDGVHISKVESRYLEHSLSRTFRYLELFVWSLQHLQSTSL